MPVILQHREPPFENTFRELLERSRLDTIIVVVPTKRRIRHLTREVLAEASRGVSPALPIHTLESLAGTLYGSGPGALSLVGGAVQTLVFDAAIRSVSGRLSYFRVKERDRRLFQGTFDKVADVISALKESGVYPPLLEEEAADAPLDERPKLLDIAAIYREYDRQLDALAVEDTGGMYRRLHLEWSQEQFEKTFRREFPRVSRISLAGFDEFTPPEIAFLRRLCALRDVAVSLLFDFRHGNPELFGHLEANYSELLDLGFREERTGSAYPLDILTVTPVRRSPDVLATIDHVGRTLFQSNAGLARHGCAGRITLIRARNRTHEIEIICRLIKKLAADLPGRDLSTICVAMPRPQLYTEIVREQFRRFDIQVNVTDRYSLRTSPVVVAIMGLLRMRLRGFRRDDVLRVAGSPYLVIPTAGGGLDAPNLSEVSRALRIVGGYRSWREKITRRLETIRKRLAGELPPPDRDTLGAEAERLLRAERDIAALHRQTSPIGVPLVPADFRRALTEMLGELQLPARIVQQTPQKSVPEIERDVRAYASFLDIVRDVTDVLALRDGHATPQGVQNYYEEIKLLLARERYNIREQFGRGVLVTSIDETRGLAIDVMIVAGLVDGELPSVYDPEVFLSAARRTLREQRHDWQDRYLFYQATTNWSEHLYLTYPERDNELELVRSSFIDAVVKVADVERWEGREDYPLARFLCTEEDVLGWWATHARASEEGVREALPASLASAYERVESVIRIERSRTGDHGLPEYEGVIAGALSEAGRAFLERMRGRTYSASQLETYRACPFQFLAGRLLRLSVTEDFREDLSPLERGTLLHEALFEFFTERRDNRLGPLRDCSDRDFEHALRRLTEILEGKLADVDVPDAFWEIDKELILGSAGSRHALLRSFLEQERQRELETEPAYFEVSFGGGLAGAGNVDPVLSRSAPVRAGEILLRGKVDRVETGDGFFTVVDYKTGRSLPTSEEIRTGVSLQLPLYLFAVGQLLQEAGLGAMAPAAGLYCQLREPIRTRTVLGNAEYRDRAFAARAGSPSLVPDRDRMDDVLRRSIDAARQCVEGIARGEFPLTDPENSEKVCTYCQYKAICRIQTVRYVRSQEKESV